MRDPFPARVAFSTPFARFRHRQPRGLPWGYARGKRPHRWSRRCTASARNGLSAFPVLFTLCGTGVRS